MRRTGPTAKIMRSSRSPRSQVSWRSNLVDDRSHDRRWSSPQRRSRDAGSTVTTRLQRDDTTFHEIPHDCLRSQRAPRPYGSSPARSSVSPSSARDRRPSIHGLDSRCDGNCGHQFRGRYRGGSPDRGLPLATISLELRNRGCVPPAMEADSPSKGDPRPVRTETGGRSPTDVETADAGSSKAVAYAEAEARFLPDWARSPVPDRIDGPFVVVRRAPPSERSLKVPALDMAPGP